jgi:hypothetical protein
MKFCIIFIASFLLWSSSSIWGQSAYIIDKPIEIALVSDTQAPLGIEKLWLKSHQNKLATRKIFEEISLQKPDVLLLLGDVVSLGSKESKWEEMDQYLAQIMGILIELIYI